MAESPSIDDNALDPSSPGLQRLDSESQATDIVWSFLDIDAEIDISHRNRPHWDQSGALTFVTFRLADSLPKSVVHHWRMEQKRWLAANSLEHLSIDELHSRSDIPIAIRRQFQTLRKQLWQNDLDCCHGSCLLRDPLISHVVAQSLLKFDGLRYDLERFVIMPNHVHLLVQMRSPWELRKQCEGWLRFTGRKINRLQNRTGACWQSEPFDHIVRSEEQFRYLQKYIIDNPQKARLKAGNYQLWIRGLS